MDSGWAMNAVSANMPPPSSPQLTWPLPTVYASAAHPARVRARASMPESGPKAGDAGPQPSGALPEAVDAARFFNVGFGRGGAGTAPPPPPLRAGPPEPPPVAGPVADDRRGPVLPGLPPTLAVC